MKRFYFFLLNDWIYSLNKISSSRHLQLCTLFPTKPTLLTNLRSARQQQGLGGTGGHSRPSGTRPKANSGHQTWEQSRQSSQARGHQVSILFNHTESLVMSEYFCLVLLRSLLPPKCEVARGDFQVGWTGLDFACLPVSWSTSFSYLGEIITSDYWP